jgi:hypothetical protein
MMLFHSSLVSALSNRMSWEVVARGCGRAEVSRALIQRFLLVRKGQADNHHITGRKLQDDKNSSNGNEFATGNHDGQFSTYIPTSLRLLRVNLRDRWQANQSWLASSTRPSSNSRLSPKSE